jgi:hypothetical protein
VWITAIGSLLGFIIIAAIEQRSCAGNVLTVERMRSVAATLSSPNATPAAQQLADQYWRLYGAQALAELGC